MTRLRSYLAKRRWLQVALALAVLAVAAAGAYWFGGYAARVYEGRDQAKAPHVQCLVGTMWAVVREDFGEGHLEPGDEYIRDVLATRVRLMWESADLQRSGTLRTPWGGAVTAGGGATVGLDADACDRFWIRVDGLPRVACISVANAFVADSPALEVRVGDRPPGAIVADRAAIEAGCDGGRDDGVGMVFDMEAEA